MYIRKGRDMYPSRPSRLIVKAIPSLCNKPRNVSQRAGPLVSSFKFHVPTRPLELARLILQELFNPISPPGEGLGVGSYCTMPAAFALSVVMSAVSTAITMSMMRFSVLFVLSVISSSFLLVVSFEFVNRQLLIVNR